MCGLAYSNQPNHPATPTTPTTPTTLLSHTLGHARASAPAAVRCEPGVILELAFALALGIYPPGESCPVGHIYIVSRGAALFAARPYLPGTSWGEADAVL